MNRRTLIVLASAIVVLSAILVSNRQDFERNEVSSLLPGFDNELNDVTKLMIKGAGNRTATTLMRGSERWTVAERGNYPADVGKIRHNLISLAKATVVEEKTADPSLYPRLGVEDIANEDATGVELIIDSPGETYRVIIGRTGIRGDQAYARKPGSAVSLLIAANLDLGAEPTDWLERAIIDVPSSDVFRVTTTHPDGEIVRIEKAGPEVSGFELANLPADAELAYSGVTDSIGSALAGLTLDDVTTRTDAGIDTDRPIVTRFETFDGLIIVANVYANDSNSFVGFEFTTDAELAARFAPPGQDEATGDAPMARANALNARLGKWLYVLPANTLDQLTRRMADLLS